ncbi:MAG: biopolymer transporter ExbD [Aphanocapsa feldmannii 277cV]|uniref:Biopolymer transporter ExbD n=2 Tax=Aphanocapsa feldmannii TaxID=192050 RepID=A0A524RNZ6_9CHRO|nr:MAG: biopolymer transporter ExbD [Aphanocapsa feldmannii 288cV]TGG93068.1 MAG: biopolymer transporter ExbD [Aphanocapsa feldmannii 277cV]TGH23266.1 MAG: biopolymer transporter ExbD [Aphanocapsa feldmannii 277cI]
MIRRTTSKKYDDQKILPLINVVFLLLIFFMVAGQHLTTSGQRQFELPKSSSKIPMEPDDLTLSMGTDGVLAINGEIVDKAELSSVIAVHCSPSNCDTLSIRLEAEATASAVAVVEVMELLHKAGVSSLQLLTSKQDS